MKASILSILSIATIWASNLVAQNQIPTGTWRSHFSYRNAKVCEASSKFIYSASENGFWRTSNIGEMTLLKKEDGFNGIEITSLKYNSNADVLVIGYADGNIDLLFKDQQIQNIPGFKNKLLQGDKRINHCSFSGNDAILSTNFGLLIIDISKREIRDSYTSIGNNGQEIPLFASTVMGDSIYVGTTTGIRSAKYSRTINLNDFNQWKWAFESSSPCFKMSAWNDSLFFEHDSTIKKYYRGSVSTAFSSKRSTAKIFTNSEGLHIGRQGSITKINDQGYTVEPVNLIADFTQFYDKIYWFCTGIGPGIIKKDLNGEVAFMPNGPDQVSVFKMSKEGNMLLTTGGGLSSTFGNAFNNSGFYLYNADGWKSNLSSPLNVNMYDFTFVAYHPTYQSLYAATHSNGILIIQNGEIKQKMDETNTPLKRINDSSFLHLGGMAVDSKGNFWVVNYAQSKPLLCRSFKGEWFSFGLLDEQEITSLTIDANDRKWMTLKSGGIIVFHEGESLSQSNDDRMVRIGKQHGLVSTEVLSIAADKNGYVWIGTNQGLNIYTGSQTLFSNPKVDRFIVDQDGKLGYLLGEETITDILVDGGSRKWFATRNGLFCADEYGQQVIKRFSTENSPLISNNIICLGQIDNTGELFIGTDKGIVSYRNDAASGNNNFGEIKIYPNPVPPKYDGIITIEGLAENAEIRITDLHGRLVYQTKANGSKATWDGYRLDGSKPNSGVFFVFGMNNDGSETAMGKFIFIR